MPDEDASPLRSPLPIFLYDADCGFCAAAVRWLLRRGARLDFRPCRSRPPEMDRAGLTLEDCRRAAWVLEIGAPLRAWSGAAAVCFALRRLQGRGWRLLGWLCRLPVIRRAGDAAYVWVARNRRRRSGKPCAVQ